VGKFHGNQYDDLVVDGATELETKLIE